MNNTVIYLRTKSTQPNSEPNSLPRKGTPIGALAYSVEDNVLDVAYALQNPKDTWDRERSRRIVTKRLELKRTSCTKQRRSTLTGDVIEEQTVPKYFQITLEGPVFDTDKGTSTRPYDVLKLIVEAHENDQIKVPERLIKTIIRMQSDNEARVQKLEALAAEKTAETVVAAVSAVAATL